MSRKVEIPFTIRFVTPAVLKEADQGHECGASPFERMLRKWWRCFEMGRFRKSGGELYAQELGRREASVFGGVRGDSTLPGQVEIGFEESDSPIIEWAEGTFKDPYTHGEPDDEGGADHARRTVDRMMLNLGLVPIESFLQRKKEEEKKTR